MEFDYVQNNLTFPANLQIAGGFIPLHDPELIDSEVENGTTVTYQWLVTEDNGPGAKDLSTIAYVYGSNADPVADLYAGLFGVCVVARQVRLFPCGDLLPQCYQGRWKPFFRSMYSAQLSCCF